jgi:Tfp pilus assembly protein PilF
MEHYSQAVRLDSNNGQTRNNFVVGLANQGRMQDAIQEFSEAVRLNLDFAQGRRNLALAQEKQK